MRILITGAAGQVGRALTEVCEQAGDEVIACDRARLDIADRDSVLQGVLTSKPDAVVHAAAWTAVDACEGDPERAYRTNGLAVRHIAEASRRAGAHLLHISTDYVFDGTKPTPYVEWDTPNPQSVYGQSKLAGERELSGDPTATIVRISWVCGRHGNNMVKTLLRIAESGVDPKFVDDQIGHPTIVDDLVVALRMLMIERRPGLFHVTNQRPVTWFEFAREVFEFAGHDPQRVTPITTSDLDPPRPAPRPTNSVLDNAALRLSGLPLLPDHRDSLERLVRILHVP